VRAAVALVLAAAAALALPGCLAPFQVRVPDALLAQASGWVATPGERAGHWYNENRIETRYTFDRSSDAPPPFAGVLQVFSLRGLDRSGEDRLAAQANALLMTYAQQYNVTDLTQPEHGARTLASGVPTAWSLRDGRTRASGALFDQDVGVRLFAEWGHDGRSSTSFIAVALVQTSRTNQCPVIGACQPQETNLQTWIQVVGDPHGSVQGATSSTGFIANLETH